MADLKKFLKTPLNRKGTTQEYIDFTIARELLYGNKKEVVIDGNTYPLIRSENNLMEAEYILEKKADPRVTGGVSSGITYPKKNKKASGGLVGGQKKLDKNKDGKISGADFKMMRKGGRAAKMSAEKS